MNNKERSVFADRLRTLRRAAHLTQQDVSDRLRLHRTTYTKYETDKAAPDQACLLQLAELFQVSVDFLLGKGDTPSDEGQLRYDPDGVMGLSPQEMELLTDFRHLSDGQQQDLMQQLFRMMEEPSGE